MERPKSPMRSPLIVLSWSDRAVAGFVVGLVCGIGLSMAAALYITNSPVPFINKVQPPTANVNPGANGQLPDPNKPLYTNHAELPVAPPEHPAAPAAEEKAPAAAATAPAATAAAAAAVTAADNAGRLMLQTGAFKSPQDADAMRARLALLGLDARVTQVTQDATVLYRVRIGPYRELDDLSGIRRTLAENGIEAQVVRNP